MRTARPLGSLYETMNNTNLTNLLPEARARDFRHGYFIRLTVLATLAFAAVILVHGALLVPSYLYVSEQEQLAKARLEELSASLASSEEEAMNIRLTRLTADASRLLSFASSASAAEVIRAVLSVPRAGVSIQSLSYLPSSNGAADARLTMSGAASTRESLRAFHQGLSALPGVTQAELPLSAYAKETDIAYTITLSGTLSP